MKKNHNYYYQCQGLLYVCKMKWIDFVVRTENPYELHIERIMSDEDFIAKFIPKLKQFYHKALLPEIVIPRHGKFPGIREPGIWVRLLCYVLIKILMNLLYMSRIIRKPTICICENKDADQLSGNRKADQHLCF